LSSKLYLFQSNYVLSLGLSASTQLYLCCCKFAAGFMNFMIYIEL